MSERRSLLQESLAAIERLQDRLTASERANHQPIAIIGAGCRYPGGIENPQDLWRVVRDRVNAVSEVPADRWDANAYYDADPQAPGKMVTKRGGFLSQVDQFDPQFFGISPREASTLDPQQRLLLETACEALESAGLATDKLNGSATGVFVGITTSDYGQLMRLGGAEHSDVYSATGSALNAAAGRIAFTFGLQGPCVSVDTACSSSLVAVHLACQSLRVGESDLALAGGVNVILSPDAMVLFSKWGMMAPDGACKTFDAGADGFVRAEGCAVIALKRLSDALAAQDPILAVIRGSAVNSDGRSSGLTVPNGPAQEAVLRKALASAALDPRDIDYVEAHGTGTSLGDPIEAEALGAVMREGREPDAKLRIGSIKSNIGHTEAASGLAGLLKVVMSLQHEAIPASLHFTQPNPRIPWTELPLEVPTSLLPWARGDRPRRGGVSSFGFSGTNAHVILEEAPSVSVEAQSISALGRVAGAAFLVPVSARDEPALRAIAGRYVNFMTSNPDASLADVALTAGTGRVHLPKRMAIIADSEAALEKDLRAVAAGEHLPSIVEGSSRAGERTKIAFLFTGQGSQYAGMGRRLYDDEAVFRETLDRAALILNPRLTVPLLDVLFPADGSGVQLAQTAYTQPALFALEYALAQVWRSWGIVPSVVLGHSVGEYVAACVAGVFSFEEGLGFLAERGRLMQALPAGGGMAAVFAEEDRLAPFLQGFAGRLSLAAINGPEETVVSGDVAAVQEFLTLAAAAGIKSRPLEVSHAFHSSLLDPMLDALERHAGTIKMQAPRIQLISNLTGQPFAAGTGPDARYWRRHAREPVRFAACIESLVASGASALVEVGPHPTLLALVARAVPRANWTATASLRRGRDDRREMLSSLGALYVRGAAVIWGAVNASGTARRIALPPYAFQRARHWVGPTDPQTQRDAAAFQPGVHPLLGRRHELAGGTADYIWENLIDLGTHPWLADHQVQGAAIVPATAYIEMALAAASEVLGAGSLSVRHIENLKPIVLHAGVARLVQAKLQVGSDGSASFAVYSRINAGSAAVGKRQAWTKHVTATVSRIPSADPRAQTPALIEERSRCTDTRSGAEFYAALAQKGNQWGPCFQGVDQLWIGDAEVVGRVRVATMLHGDMDRYCFHPAVSDACGHPMVATVALSVAAGATAGAFVGGGVGEIRFHRSPVGSTLWVYARRHESADADSRVVIGDVYVYDEGGALVSETLDARLWYLDDHSSVDLIGVPDDWYYQATWHSQTLAAKSDRAAAAGTWLIFGDHAGVGAQIVDRRKASGTPGILVTPGEEFCIRGDVATIRPGVPDDYQRLVKSFAKISAVIHLWSLDFPTDSANVAQVMESLRNGSESTLYLIHALRAAACQPRLWLVTAGTQSVVAEDRCAAPWCAALWGLGRTLSTEHAELWGGLIDLEAGSPAALAERVVAEVEQTTREDKIAFRGDRRYVARLTRVPAAAVAGGDSTVLADRTYLVSGGLGGIGLAMAGWLADRGARHLLLLGRTPLPDRRSWPQLGADTAVGRRVAAILALESKGVVVETAAVDISVEGPLEACLEGRRKRGEPRIGGVIHAAGTLQFQALASQDPAALRAGLAAKMIGAWRLHRLLADTPLDCFVLCSSSSALLSSPLLGGYAAGNAFLDSLAHHRRAKDLPALSINWGTWGEVGMAVEAGRSANGGMLSGLGTISTARGLAALQQLLGAGAVQVAVMPIDWPLLTRTYPAFATDPFLAELAGEAAPAVARVGTLSLLALRSAPADRHGDMIVEYLRCEAARALGMSADALDPVEPLSSFGFDSLMAVQLKNRIETDLRVVMPMIQFLQGPSVLQLGPELLAAVQALNIAAGTDEETLAEEWEEGSI